MNIKNARLFGAFFCGALAIVAGITKYSASAEGSISANAGSYYEKLKNEIESDNARLVSLANFKDIKQVKDELGVGFNFGNSLDFPIETRKYKFHISIGYDDTEYYHYDQDFTEEANLYMKENHSSPAAEYANIKLEQNEGVEITDDTKLNYVSISISNDFEGAHNKDLTVSTPYFKILAQDGTYVTGSALNNQKYTIQLTDDQPVTVVKRNFNKEYTNAEFFGTKTRVRANVELEDFVSDLKGHATDVYNTYNGEVATDAELKFLKEQGIQSVRIPVTYYSHMDYTGTVDQDWFDELNRVVNRVLSYGFYVILDVHHDTGKFGWIKADKDYIAKYEESYRYLFLQIANNFKHYDEHLILEGTNEILNYFNYWVDNEWHTISEEDYAAANQINQMFVDEIRRTGYNNSNRLLLLNTYGAQIESLPHFVMPQDSAKNRIFVGIHEYTVEENGVLQALNYLSSEDGKQYLDKYDLLLGEYGIYRSEALDKKIDFMEKNVALSYQLGIPAYYWDEGGNRALMRRMADYWDTRYNSDQVAKAMIDTAKANMKKSYVPEEKPVEENTEPSKEEEATPEVKPEEQGTEEPETSSEDLPIIPNTGITPRFIKENATTGVSVVAVFIGAILFIYAKKRHFRL